MTHTNGDVMLYKKNIERLIIHCSDTKDDQDLGAIDIHKMHLRFGWNGIGYHKVIKRNGQIENGRPEYWIGAHTKGLNNKSLGVCLIGQNRFTEEQFNSLEVVLNLWKSVYKNVKVLGHRDAIETNKTCPNFNVKNWLEKRKLI